jgi:hypothetical protein
VGSALGSLSLVVWVMIGPVVDISSVICPTTTWFAQCPQEVACRNALAATETSHLQSPLELKDEILVLRGDDLVPRLLAECPTACLCLERLPILFFYGIFWSGPISALILKISNQP